MKSKRWAMLVVLFSTLSFCKGKPVTYDRTGTIVFDPPSVSADFTGHYDTKDGQSYDYYCYTSTSSVDCHEGIQGSHKIRQSDGATFLFFSPIPGSHTFEYGVLQHDSPLLDLMIYGRAKEFRFRLAKWLGDLVICVPYDVVDKKGTVRKQRETCYMAEVDQTAGMAAEIKKQRQILDSQLPPAKAITCETPLCLDVPK